MDIKEFISQKVIDAYNYDIEYYTTLKVFLETNQNYKQTSEILYIHPKTVRYRIEKLKSLFGFDFNNSDEILQIQISIKIHEFDFIKIM